MALPARLRAALIGFALFLAAAPARAEPVDLELVLAVDVSRSVDDEEFALQAQGYVAAFAHPRVLAAIGGGRHRAIAVTMVHWAGPRLQQVVIPWTRIDSVEASLAFSDRLKATPRAFHGGGTSVSGVIDFSRELFGKGGFAGERRVIDISGDGINNSGRLPEVARDEAVAAGININALAILTDVAGLDRYFREYVIGGPGSFVIEAEDFTSFAAAILSKLIREIAEVPR